MSLGTGTPTPATGQIITDYTRGGGLSFDTISSTQQVAPAISSIASEPSGGINVTQTGTQVLLQVYIFIANNAGELPGADLPLNQNQGILAFRRDLGRLQFYDPVTATWTTV